MGIDQVARVTDIVKQALARRAVRLQTSPKSKVQSPKPKVRAPKDSGIQGSRFEVQGSKFPPSEPSSPSSVVTACPRYIPDYATPRYRLTPRHLGYANIPDGTCQ